YFPRVGAFCMFHSNQSPLLKVIYLSPYEINISLVILLVNSKIESPPDFKKLRQRCKSKNVPIGRAAFRYKALFPVR
ncbi:MAG: hypothetical protein RR194_04780, partial [Ruthenibacterium sp.]